jgi:hypothetical protein
VIAQLDILGRTFQGLFGIVGESLAAEAWLNIMPDFFSTIGGADSTEEFESLFAAHSDEEDEEDGEEASSSENDRRN